MKKIYIVMAVLATAALAGCQQEKSFEEARQIGENEIVFTFASTKADVASAVRRGVVIPIESKEAGVNMYLEETIVDLNEFGPATKGTPAYTENVGVLYKDDLSVYGDKGVTASATTFSSMDGETVGGGWRYNHVYASDPWAEGAVGFYLNMPAAPEGVNITGRTGGKFTFSYTSPGTAADQADIIFAYRTLTKAEHNGYLPNGAPVLFNHALTAVKFAIANPNEATITSITFNGLKNTGTCVITPVGARDDDENNDYKDDRTNYTSGDGRVVWTASAAADNTITSGTYNGTTTYEKNTAGSFGENKGDYPKSFSNGGNENNLGGSDGSQIFWLIPQSFDASSTVTLTITYKYNGGEESSYTIDFGKALGAASVEWKAGQLRTYTLKVNDFNVKIEDNVSISGNQGNGFSGSTKTGVTITNTGSTDAYIRAALIGQWHDNAGNPVFGFTDNTGTSYELVESWYYDQFVETGEGARSQGTFVRLPGYDGADTTLNNWEYNSADGFYYYTKPVAPEKETGYQDGENYVVDKLFDSYTVGTAPIVRVAGEVKPVYFTLEIATQAISANKPDGTPYTFEEAWARTK